MSWPPCHGKPLNCRETAKAQASLTPLGTVEYDEGIAVVPTIVGSSQYLPVYLLGSVCRDPRGRSRWALGNVLGPQALPETRASITTYSYLTEVQPRDPLGEEKDPSRISASTILQKYEMLNLRTRISSRPSTLEFLLEVPDHSPRLEGIVKYIFGFNFSRRVDVPNDGSFKFRRSLENCRRWRGTEGAN